MWSIVHYEMDSTWAPKISPIISVCEHELGSRGVDKNCHLLYDSRAPFHRGDESPCMIGIRSNEIPTY